MYNIQKVIQLNIPQLPKSVTKTTTPIVGEFTSIDEAIEYLMNIEKEFWEIDAYEITDRNGDVVHSISPNELCIFKRKRKIDTIL